MTSHRRPTGLRLLAAAWALVVAAGAVEIHAAGEAWGHETAGFGDEPIFVCDGSHRNALHVEAAHAVERERCPGCLHRLQIGGGGFAAALSTSLPPADSGLVLFPAPHVAFALGRAGSSRAPPLS